MDSTKYIRWRQRFQDYEKSYHVLERNAQNGITTVLERAGLIHLFEVIFDLGQKVLKDYLEGEGYSVNGPRETIKTAFQAGIIEDGHVWMDALSDRNLVARTYDESVAEKLVEKITEIYCPALGTLYRRLSLER